MTNRDLVVFFEEVRKLNKLPKTGWKLIGVKNPEAVSSHAFRVAVMAWMFGCDTKDKFNVTRLLKGSLVHDLCEVYAGDITPYDGRLPKDKKKWPALFDQWPRLSKEQKAKRFTKKHEKERKSLEKLTKNLAPDLREEIFDLWLDHERGTTKHARFVKQIERLETLLQALEYAKKMRKRLYKSWWIGSKEIVDHPCLVGLFEEFDTMFYKKKKADPTLAFVSEIGKLKQLPRRGWVTRRIKNPETIGDHTFMVAMMTYVLGRGLKLNMERMIKMALTHEICAVYTGDYTPHDVFSRGLLSWFSGGKAKPRLERKEKQKLFLKTYDKETKALNKLVKELPPKLRREVLGLWKEFVERTSKEADFVDQVNCLATYLQAVEYWQQNEKFPLHIFAEQTVEFVHHPRLATFLEAANKRYHTQAKKKK